MTAAMGRAAFVALCGVSLAACALFSSAPAETKKFMLNDLPGNLPTGQTHPATLLVQVPEAAPIYATTQIAYMEKADQIAYFSQNEWAETPSEMLQPLIVETLRRTHYFKEVLPSPDPGRHTFVLRAELLELKQDFTSDPAALQLTMRFSLGREASGQVMATKQLSVREPMRERNPYAGVEAANKAVAKLLGELAGFVTGQAGQGP